MAFSIDQGAPLDAEIRRLAGKQLVRIEKALGGARDADATDAELGAAASGEDAFSTDVGHQTAVFEARKRLKKLRGLMRLVRDVAPRFYAEDNLRYREAAARLSTVRDRSAAVEALDRLAAHHAGRIEPSAFAAIREALNANVMRSRETMAGGCDEAHMAAIDATLRDVGEARHRMDGFVIKRSKNPAGILAKGFSRTYGKSRRGLKALKQDSDAEAFHALRKPLKYHWFHLRLLGSAWPELLVPMAACAKAVVDDLGHDHDCEILRQTVLAMLDEPGTVLPASEVSLIFVLLDQRQEELRSSALSGARRLFVIETRAMERWMRAQLKFAAVYRENATRRFMPSATDRTE